MKVKFPKFVTQYFWGDNLQELNLSTHKKYITQTLLEKGDTNALKWLFDKVGKTEIYGMLSKMKLSKKSANFWHQYLS